MAYAKNNRIWLRQDIFICKEETRWIVTTATSIKDWVKREIKKTAEKKLRGDNEDNEDDDEEEYEDADDSTLQTELDNRELNAIARAYLTNFIINNKTRKVPYGIYHTPWVSIMWAIAPLTWL